MFYDNYGGGSKDATGGYVKRKKILKSRVVR